MAELYDITQGHAITRFVSLDVAQGVKRIINTALDGTTYIQVIGTPSVTYQIEAYVDAGGKARLFLAEADCNLLRATVQSGTFYGRITALSCAKMPPSRYHKATITLAAEEVT